MAEKMTDDETKEEAKEEIALIFKTAHRKRSGNILLFLIHHAPRNSYLTDKLNNELNLLFEGVVEATLRVEETAFFEDYLENYSTPTIEKDPSKDNREQQRQLLVKKEQAQEESDSQISEEAEEADEKDDQFIVDFGKSLRMIRIVGQLVKTEQALKKEQIYDLSKNVEGLALRMLSFGHEIMRENPISVQYFIENIYLNKIDGWEEMAIDKKKEILRLSFGLMSLMIAFNMINRSAHSIGSDKLFSIIGEITADNKTPATELINLAVNLWYGNKIDMEKIKEMKEQWEKDNHFVAYRTLQRIVVEHLYLRKVKREERQQLSILLDIPIKKQLLIEQKRQRDK